jgi:hypothetical protein
MRAEFLKFQDCEYDLVVRSASTDTSGAIASAGSFVNIPRSQDMDDE